MESYACAFVPGLFHRARSLPSAPSRVTARGRISVLAKAGRHSTVWLRHILMTHSSASGLLDCFCPLAVLRNAAVNTGVQMSLRDADLHSLGDMLVSGIAGSDTNSIFNFWRSRHTVAREVHTSTAHPRCARAPCLTSLVRAVKENISEKIIVRRTTFDKNSHTNRITLTRGSNIRKGESNLQRH